MGRILSLEKFLSTISRTFPGGPLAGREEALARLDPEKIYLENVRSVLGVSSSQAFRICEAAVRRGVFQRMTEVLCPDGAVAASASMESELPERVHCWIDEGGQLADVEIPTSELTKTTFYRFKDARPEDNR
jgi:hypothetical protein